LLVGVPRRGLDRKDNNNLTREAARNEGGARERHACTRVAHALGFSRARQKGREAICRMTNERRATWVASAVAGNGEQRAVSPRALSHSSCLGGRGRNERNRRTTRVRFSLDPHSVRKEVPSLRFPLRARAKREPLEIRARPYIGVQSAIDRDEYRNSERTRLQSGYIFGGRHSNARTRTRTQRARTGKATRVCTCAAGRHIMSNGGDCARAP